MKQSINSQSAREYDQGGAVLMELALSLPLFLILTYIFIWLGVMLNARASLSNGMSNALRLAATRSNMTTAGKEILPELNAWLNGGPITANIEDILVINVSHGSNINEYLQRYMSCLMSGDPFPGLASEATAMNALPAPYVYSVVYLNEALRKSIGGVLKTPCKPGGAANSCLGSSYVISDDDGPGCVACRFLNPAPLADPPMTNLPRGQIDIECTYEPDSLITKPLSALLSLFGGETSSLISVTRHATFTTGYLPPPP